MGMGKRYCPQGHDTFICGRDSSRTCRKCATERTQRWRDADPRNHERMKRAYQRAAWRRHGMPDMTEERYQEMLAAQGGVCAGPGCDATTSNAQGARLVVDHDHDTGEIRGLLCTPCNVKDVLASPTEAA